MLTYREKENNMIANDDDQGRKEYRLGMHQGAIDGITVGGLATGGLSLLEYDNLLFGMGPVSGGNGQIPNRQVASPDRDQPRTSKPQTINSAPDALTRANPGWEQNSDGIWRRSASPAPSSDDSTQANKTATGGQVGNANEVPYGNPLNARFKDAGGTPFGNDPMGTGFAPGPDQDKENLILASPVKAAAKDLTNI
jgi:hypothetical protein